MAIARFTFIGTPVVPKEKAKRPFYKEIEKVDGKNKRQMATMTFGIKESDTNMAFVEAFDSVQDQIQTMNTDNEKMTVDWDERTDEDVISQVANYRKYVVDLGEDFGGRQEFITMYDAMQYLNENLRDYNGKIMVTGQLSREWYAKKGVYMDKYKFQNVYAVDESEYKNRLGLVIDIFYNKNSIDKSDFKEDKKIYLNGYIEQYINKDEGKKYVPMQFVFSAAKYNMDDEKHKKLFDYKMSYLDVSNKNMVHIPWEVVLIRGAEEAEFNESMLTDKQKQQIELGLKTLEDFRPRGTIVGDKVNEYRMFDPQLKDDFADGVVEVEDTLSEFEENIYQPPQDETLDEAKKKSKETKKTEDDEPPLDTDDKADEVDPDDLF